MAYKAARRADSVELCVLGSGSSGNCSVLRAGGRVMLLDAGFGPVTTTRRLQQAGVRFADVQAICVTHLDADHFRPNWPRTLLGFGVPVYLHRWLMERFSQMEGGPEMIAADLARPFDDAPFAPIDGIEAHPIHLAHDRKGTTGFRLRTRHGDVGYATDLGRVPGQLIEHFAGIDVLAIECNYDPGMQLGSARPVYLKKRIMGGSGHLSNEQAFDAVQQIDARSPSGRPAHIVLLHRSRQCNTPQRVHEVFAQNPTIARRIVLSDQRRRSAWLRITGGGSTGAAQQMTWAF